MCSVHVSLSKYTFTQLGNSGFAQAIQVPFALKCFPSRKGPNGRGTTVELGICKDIFNSESFLNIHGLKKKSLVINYSNVHSFLKHFKDVYIETRCLPPPPPQTAPISVDFTALLLTSVFSVGSLFHSRVERMFLLFAFLAIPVASLWRELPPCCDLASIPFISLLKVTCTRGGKSFLIPHVLWAFPTSPLLGVVGILQQLELQNKEVESVWETYLIEQGQS